MESLDESDEEELKPCEVISIHMGNLHSERNSSRTLSPAEQEVETICSTILKGRNEEALLEGQKDFVTKVVFSHSYK